MNIVDYHYDLPEARIAKFPLEERDGSKLLVYRNGCITADVFSNLPDYMGENDVMTFNNTRVIRARIEMEKVTGARIEIFCIEPHEPSDYQLAFTQRYTCQWKCMVGNFRKWKSGVLKKQLICNETTIELQAERVGCSGKYHLIRFSWNGDIDFGSILNACGRTPIPPYLKRKTEEIDETRYQTVYSRHSGSVAAPTAGLHFTPQLLQQLSDKRVKQSEITLHVGAGTFLPVKQNDVTQHDMHVEYFSVSLDTICDILSNNGVLTAVGTTSLRALESVYWLGVKMLQKNSALENFHLEQWESYKLPQDISVEKSLKKICKILESNKLDTLWASTKIMIVPGYAFRVCSRLITNFHQPQSSLLLLVSAFVGERWKDIYSYALENDFRFLSYGDSSLLELSSTSPIMSP